MPTHHWIECQPQEFLMIFNNILCHSYFKYFQQYCIFQTFVLNFKILKVARCQGKKGYLIPLTAYI